MDGLSDSAANHKVLQALLNILNVLLSAGRVSARVGKALTDGRQSLLPRLLRLLEHPQAAVRGKVKEAAFRDHVAMHLSGIPGRMVDREWLRVWAIGVLAIISGGDLAAAALPCQPGLADRRLRA